MQVGEAVELAGIVGNLQRQLPGRREHQRPRLTPVPCAVGGVVQQPGDCRDQKRRGFSSTGLRLAGNVQPVQAVLQRFRLNRCAVGKAGCVDRTPQCLRQIEATEGNRRCLGAGVATGVRFDHDVGLGLGTFGSHRNSVALNAGRRDCTPDSAAQYSTGLQPRCRPVQQHPSPPRHFRAWHDPVPAPRRRGCHQCARSRWTGAPCRR